MSSGIDLGGTEPGTTAGWSVRPMTVDDVEAAMSVIEKADTVAATRAGRPQRPPRPSPAQLETTRRAHVRFVERDGPGAWVADCRGIVIGVAESVRRGPFWGLSMLFVHPDAQSRGVGGRLLEAALGYAAGASTLMIQSSPDPRALRRYALAGLTMHPAAELGGEADRRAIPRRLPGRSGDSSDIELVADVDAGLDRDRSEDVAFGLEQGNRLDVVADGSRRGWVLWSPGRLFMLGATDEDTAAALLWRYLAGNEGEVLAYGLTAAQNWAFDVAHAAHLTLHVGGAVFVDGVDRLPGPWIPSGWYF